MIGMVVHLVILLVLVLSTDSLARRSYITPEQKTQLARIQTILVSVLALSEKGLAPSDHILGWFSVNSKNWDFGWLRMPLNCMMWNSMSSAKNINGNKASPAMAEMLS